MEEDKHVVVTIKPSGKVGVEANNFNGVGCTEATEQIEVGLPISPFRFGLHRFSKE